MKFKDYFENYDNILSEASTINMGDFAELIFSVGLLHYTLKKQVKTEEILNTINEIPSLPYENTFSHGNYDVALQLEGKEGLSNLIGGNFKNLSPKHQEQVLDIMEKVAKHVPNLRTIHKVDRFIKQTREMENANSFIIVIKLSGSKTTQKGDVKADVTMEILPHSNIQIPKDIKNISYSVKYDKEKKTSKVAEPTIFNVILRLGLAFNLPMTRGLEDWDKLPYDVGRGSQAGKWKNNYNGVLDAEKYKKLSQIPGHLLNYILKLISSEEKFNDKSEVVKKFMLEFNDEMVIKEKQQPLFSTTLFDFLEKEIFGRDLADVVKIDITGMREIDIEEYKKIKETCLVDFSTRPTKSKSLIFEFEAFDKGGNRFRLFWIDNEPTGAKIHIGEDLLK